MKLVFFKQTYTGIVDKYVIHRCNVILPRYSNDYHASN